MHLADSIKSSFVAIISHKLRSTLTLLGIMIGVAAVVTMFSAVYGIKDYIKNTMEKMGWNYSLIVVSADGSETQSRRHRRFMYMQRKAKPLSLDDYEFLLEKYDFRYSYGMIELWDRYTTDEIKKWVQLRATNNDFFNAKTYPLKSGRYFNRFEERNSAKVCIIGHGFYTRYLKNEEKVLGKTITIGSNRYKIIGILEDDTLNKNGMDFNQWERRHDLRAVYIPLATGSHYLRPGLNVDYIYFQAYDEASYNEMQNIIRQQLLVKHKMAHDFSFQNIGDMLLKITDQFNDMMKKWNVTLSTIASISLIVGGIGLFSTLLISINERMMEIGVRKSIGATDFDIFFYFLVESIVLACMGAVTGILTSSLLILGISALIKISFPIPLQGILIGLGFSLVIGILSGLYPAVKASRIDPIKAIYYFD